MSPTEPLESSTERAESWGKRVEELIEQVRGPTEPPEISEEKSAEVWLPRRLREQLEAKARRGNDSYSKYHSRIVGWDAARWMTSWIVLGTVIPLFVFQVQSPNVDSHAAVILATVS